ncbi:hypothetical protein L1D51_21235 [Pseudoalteromonas shioyasakiensis]|uniref:hypothetical protein n=1 Tax=Pseudoalteromonas shioyasakiensis TaxID=1190813 RepID=UPI001EFD4356|nr:hypothetical protein [Pseudoalteromonas shioyasakiensis]MCG9736481.1 hypothetical protein [Pseudoalteromonas shioyasakiensis]
MDIDDCEGFVESFSMKFKQLGAEVNKKSVTKNTINAQLTRDHFRRIEDSLESLKKSIAGTRDQLTKTNSALIEDVENVFLKKFREHLSMLLEMLRNIPIPVENSLGGIGMFDNYRDLLSDIRSFTHNFLTSNYPEENSNGSQLHILDEKLEQRIEIKLNSLVQILDEKFTDEKNKLLNLHSIMKNSCQEIENNSNEFQNKISSLESSVTNIEQLYNDKVKSINDIYNNGMNDIAQKEEQIDKLLSTASNRVMADDFDTSAAEEKKAANWLRLGSLGCMAVIIGIVCYSFYDSTHSGFDWESSIFRTVLVFILSIPAAYLSRESAKHREQQYNYHHTALDLKAITPYIASLPEEDQNRIKISIAERIFASRQTNLNQQDSFPLNTQELMMELIKKVDLSSNQKAEKKKDDTGKEV